MRLRRNGDTPLAAQLEALGCSTHDLQCMSSCYMCHAQAVTREHAPPLSFFPREYRSDLWTVPACPKHNHANSRDVEYVRSIIAMDVHTSNIARQLVRDPVSRSWKRSSLLKARTFGRVVPALVRGRPSAIVETEFGRFERIIGSIAHAIYFRETGSRWLRDWMA
jgi:hypothetical protein